MTGQGEEWTRCERKERRKWGEGVRDECCFYVNFREPCCVDQDATAQDMVQGRPDMLLMSLRLGGSFRLYSSLLKIETTLATLFHTWDTVPWLSEARQKMERTGVISEESSFNSRVDISSGPDALCGCSSERSFRTQEGVNWIRSIRRLRAGPFILDVVESSF